MPVDPETTALIEALGPAQVARFADLGGGSPSLVLAAWKAWGCEIALVDMDRGGRFPTAESEWVAPYRARLLEAGVPPASINVVRTEKDLPLIDAIANLHGFGDRWKSGGLVPVLARCLREGTRMILDIRKGSGAFPLLKAAGTCETLSTRVEDGKPVTRVIFRANPPVELQQDQGWAGIARELAGEDGFYQESAEHSMLFVPRGRVLVVTFDNLDIAMTKREERRPWGFHFIEKQGWSMLGVMANGWTWYRDPWVSAEFDRLRDEGFFARFDRVVFYGASMGGYAACAFSAACPGADVVAISPQSTLDRTLVPWETRYSTAWGRDFSGPYGDAAITSQTASRVSLLYDPYEPLDSGHVARFQGANVVRLRTPLLGHRLGSSLLQMGVLTPIILGALNGTLTEGEFYRILRARKTFPRYQKELFKRAVARGRPALARKLARWVLVRGDNRYIRKALAKL
ncbi:MAG: hypothetical protein DI533_04930 [Cereibacter sphaeroides]|uniref:Phosphoadenosine phosphosulfate reductase n=1 Tax=Cereibacter sphaeroides TaxID=1063 RepID=A0A2W5U9F0_CERSP|nr:MAG: hypothetical protein DI533_04930 [Cereibacter sphaeroides]